MKSVLEERGEYDVVSTDSGSGEEGEREEENARPPSPPPRPKHTLSQQSIAVNKVNKDDLQKNSHFTETGSNGRTTQPGVDGHSSRTAKRKSSWRKHRPSVSVVHVCSLQALTLLSVSLCRSRVQ